jgi:hypothetical protein
MWAAWVVVAIAWAAVAFMLRFLIALLREGEPSVCFWVVPVHRERKKNEHLKVVRGIYSDDDCRATERDRTASCAELLENQDYANEDCSSGLIALDVRHVSKRLGRRSIHPRRGDVFREHWL